MLLTHLSDTYYFIENVIHLGNDGESNNMGGLVKFKQNYELQ